MVGTGLFLSSSSGKKSMTDADLSDDDLGYEDEGSESHSLQVKVSRTTQLIQDYKQFIAARRLQAFWRGYRARKLHHLRWNAAITVQRWWRGFRVRSRKLLDLERRLQEALVEHYHRSAVKIQSLFRGWWIRYTVHDANILYRMQVRAVEDLLHCLSLKLHHLKRTNQIPGVYSLRQSDCLSQVEMIMSTQVFRFYNTSVCGLLVRRTAQAEERRRLFQRSKYNTAIPYSGPNFNMACTSPDSDQIEQGLSVVQGITEYEKSRIDPNLLEIKQHEASRKRGTLLEQIRAQQKAKKQIFCEYVIQSMRKWKVWDGEQIDIKNDLFQDAEHYEQFLENAAHLLDELMTCYCSLGASQAAEAAARCNPQLTAPIE